MPNLKPPTLSNAKQKLSRAPWERILWIHERVKAGKFPNCVVMAKHFEVSEKTVKRDLEFMRDRLKLPIEYDAKRHGYFYTTLVDKFPGMAITEQEMFAMLVADKAIAQYHGTPFQKPLRMAFEKLTEQLDSNARYSMENLQEALSFRPFGPEDTDLPAFQIISRALQERRGLKFSYTNLGTRAAHARMVHPYHLACVDSRWYLFAHDVDRADIRTFVLTRLSEPVLTKDRFEKRKDFNPDEYLRGSFGVLKGSEDFEVVIEFDLWASDLLRGRQWHPTQEFVELPNGCAHVRFRLSSLDEIERWVLNWGTHATVVRPNLLRERVGATARAVADKYIEKQNQKN
jgi:predicted DNA-binding transcriptional regulator YafY